MKKEAFIVCIFLSMIIMQNIASESSSSNYSDHYNYLDLYDQIGEKLKRNLIEEAPRAAALAREHEGDGSDVVALNIYKIIGDAYLRAYDYQGVQNLIDGMKRESKYPIIREQAVQWEQKLQRVILSDEIQNFKHFVESLDQKSTPNAKSVAQALEQAFDSINYKESTNSKNDKLYILNNKIADSERYFSNTIARANVALTKPEAFKALADAENIISLLQAFMPLIAQYRIPTKTAAQKIYSFKEIYDIASREVTTKFKKNK